MKKYKYHSKIIYLTGLSASGKTTLSNLLIKKLINMGVKTKNIDGDNFRKKFKLKKYDDISRKKVAIQKFAYAESLIKKKKLIIIISGVGAKLNSRKELRNKFGDYIEIFINCPKKIREKRDKKNLYLNKKINFLNTIYEKGNTKDLIINNYKISKNKNINKIIRFFFYKKIIF